MKPCVIIGLTALPLLFLLGLFMAISLKSLAAPFPLQPAVYTLHGPAMPGNLVIAEFVCNISLGVCDAHPADAETSCDVHLQNTPNSTAQCAAVDGLTAQYAGLANWEHLLD
ncbi:unnamed protein product [Symbiodinium microadriaticum]|nr:unnamed protein product [Symbiodinium microadriaticum]